MNSRKTVIMCAAGLAMAAPMVIAGPVDKSSSNRATKRAADRAMVNPFASQEQANWSDNFDAYSVGGGIVGQGGWEIWPGGVDGIVVTTQAFSPANSLSLQPTSDLIQNFTSTSGVWEFSIQTYTPSTAPEGEGLYIILLNQYGATNHWSMQVALNDMFTNPNQIEPWLIESQFDGATLPLILDQWVEFKAIIDLDNDTMNTFYGGTPLGVDLVWTTNVSGAGGFSQIAALDLYSGAFLDPEMYLDDVSLTEVSSCPCACNVDTSTGPDICDIFDFLGFQNGFVGQDPCACDIDTSTGPGICDIFDFLAFQDEFVSGCP